ncbi:MAG: hypothetical protein JWN86_2929 [Planctomycetota bacterium]|nr:hypothetical protein [Planctomycetota bacterium]
MSKRLAALCLAVPLALSCGGCSDPDSPTSPKSAGAPAAAGSSELAKPSAKGAEKAVLQGNVIEAK